MAKTYTPEKDPKVAAAKEAIDAIVAEAESLPDGIVIQKLAMVRKHVQGKVLALKQDI